jgi:F-type H+-transporting ATPase subunit delta
MKSAKQIHREARHLWRLCAVNGRLDENRVRRSVQVIVGARRPASLAVLSDFLRLVRLDHLRHVAKVGTAAQVPPDVQEQIESALTRIYGDDLAVEYEADPTLLGGVRITVGSDVYDASVKGRLAALAARFSESGVAAV